MAQKFSSFREAQAFAADMNYNAPPSMGMWVVIEGRDMIGKYYVVVTAS